MIGKTISHYEILEKLGEGGMGVVYKAHDLDLDRSVAIKFLPPQMVADKEATKRFTHEAKTASALNHPNIGVVHEIGRSDDGQTFMVMACYEGESLRERIDRGGMNFEEALDITAQVSAGLAKAHGRGIVHRDIKPSNVLLTEDGHAVIIDFGLAKLAGRTKLTREGSTLGTAAYMSPEQARGEEVDHRSDIFSLGVMLYEMLAGERPFRGEHEAALLYEIVHEDPMPLSDYRSDLPRECQAIVDRAQSKDLAGRYQSVGDMKAEINALKEHSRDASYKNRPGQQRAGGQKRKWQTGVVIIAVAAILTSLYIRYLGKSAPAEELSLAVMDFRNLAAQEDPAISAGITELVYIGLVESSPVRVQSSDLVKYTRRQLFGSADGPVQEGQALEIARESGATLVLTGRILAGDERLIIWDLVEVRTGNGIGGKKVESKRMSAMANEIVGAVLPLIARYSGIEEPIEQVPVEQITTDNTPAYQHYIKGKLLQRQDDPDEALREYEQAIALDSSFSLAYLGLSRLHFGSVLVKGFNIDEAKRYADLAWKYRTRLGIRDRLWLDALRHSIDYRVSEEISVLKEIHERWPDDRETIYNLIAKYYFWGLAEETVTMTMKGMRLFPDDKYIGGNDYTNALAALGRIDEALRESLAYIDKNPDSPSAWIGLASAYLVLGNVDSANAAFRKVLKIDPDEGEYILAVCDYYAGNLDRAIAAFERILEDKSLPEHERASLIVPQYQAIRLAALYLEAGRYRDVIRVCDDCLVSAGENPVSLYFIGRLYVAVGQMEKASAMVREMSGSDKVGMQVHALNIQGNLLTAAGDTDEAKKAAAQLHEWAESRGYFLHGHAFETEAAVALMGNDYGTASEALVSWSHVGIWTLGLMHLEYLTMRANAWHLAGQTEKAVEVHEELLRIFGGHALSHYELGKLYEELNRPGDASREYELFLEMWSQADKGLPQLEDAKARLAELTG